MLYYRTDTWLSQIFRFNGTVLQGVWLKALLICTYTALAYAWCVINEANIGEVGKNILGPILSFLLVFRANQAYSRYWQGRTLLTDFFCDLREIVAIGLTFFSGGDRCYQWRWRHLSERTSAEEFQSLTNDSDRIASEERTHLVRWALIVGIAFQLHTRVVDDIENGTMMATTKWLVDWDRYRIRCLTTKEEFEELDRHITSLALPQDQWDDPLRDGLKATSLDYMDGEEPAEAEVFELSSVPKIRIPVVAVYRLIEVIIRNANDGKLQDKTYGIQERFVGVFTPLTNQLVKHFSMVTQIITTPLPFPYFHLCKTLLFIYFLSFPFFLDYTEGVWANVGEFSVLTVALLGIDSIGTELENPFGQDTNDLDIWEKVSGLERDIMTFVKLSGDKQLEENFVWKQMPEGLSNLSLSPITSYLALRTQVESDGKSKVIGVAPPVERSTPVTGMETPAGGDDTDSDDS